MQGRPFTPMDTEEPSDAALFGNKPVVERSYNTMDHEYGLDLPEEKIVLAQKKPQGWSGMRAVLMFVLLCLAYYFYRSSSLKNVGVVAIPLGPKGQQKLIDRERVLLDKESEEKHEAKMSQVPLESMLSKESWSLNKVEDLLKKHDRYHADKVLKDEEKLSAKVKKGMEHVEELVAEAHRDEQKVQKVGGVYLELTDAGVQDRHIENVERQAALTESFVDLEAKEKGLHDRQVANGIRHDHLKHSLGLEAKRAKLLSEQQTILKKEAHEKDDLKKGLEKKKAMITREEQDLKKVEKLTKKSDFRGAERLLKQTEQREWDILKYLKNAQGQVLKIRNEGHQVEAVARRMDSEFKDIGGKDAEISRRQDAMYKALVDLEVLDRTLKARQDADRAKHDSLKRLLR